MNECFYYLLAVDCILHTSMYNIDVPYLTHLRMKSCIAHMNTYLTSLLSHTLWNIQLS